MSDFQVSGTGDFVRLSKALKSAGRTGLRKELDKAVKAAAKPAIKAVQNAARTGLPSRGGVNEYIAGKKTTVVALTGKDPGVKVKVNKQDPRLDSAGRLAHPVFGRRPLVVQQVRPGVMSAGFQASVPDVRPKVQEALDAVVRQIVREAKDG